MDSFSSSTSSGINPLYTASVDEDKQLVILDSRQDGRIVFPYESFRKAAHHERTHLEGDTVHLALTIAYKGSDMAFCDVAIRVDEIAKFLEGKESRLEWLIDEPVMDLILIKRLESTYAIPPRVKTKILALLPEFGLTREELQRFEEYYNKNKEFFANRSTPIFISRKNGRVDLPRSLVYIPSGPHKGLHVLLKSHGGVEELGVGGHNLVTLSFCLTTGEVGACRTGKWETVTDFEEKLLKALQKYPDHFASGATFEYVGSWRPRNRNKNSPKGAIPKEEGVEKLGVIMPFYPFSLMEKIPSLDFSRKVDIVLSIGKSLTLLHDFDLVQGDLKPANILFGTDEKPRIADFGLTCEVNGNIKHAGTPGYEAPEVVESRLMGRNHKAACSSDIWSMGCMLAELFHGSDFRVFTQQAEGDWRKLVDMDQKEVDKHLQKFFPEYLNLHHPDSLIYACFRKDPKARPTAKELVERLALMQRLH